jgi:hypothetical protein
MLFKGCTIEQTWSGLSIVVFLLVGHFPCYGCHDLTLVKTYWNWFSLWVFSKGSLPKTIGVMCVRFEFPSLSLCCMSS